MKKTRTITLFLMFLFLLNLISGCQQPTEKAVKSSDKDAGTTAGYGTPPPASGYGTPPPAGGYGTPRPAGGYGVPGNK